MTANIFEIIKIKVNNKNFNFLTFLVNYLHKNLYKYKYIIDIEEVKTEKVFNIKIYGVNIKNKLKNDKLFIATLEDNVVDSGYSFEDAPKSFQGGFRLQREKRVTFKKSSIRNYIKKKRKFLEESKTLEDFYKRIGIEDYKKERYISDMIYYSFKKENGNLDKIIKYLLKKNKKDETLFLNVESSTTKQGFKIFVKRVEFFSIKENLDKSDTYGLLKNFTKK